MTPLDSEHNSAHNDSNIAPQTLYVIGIGSPHGEDIAGWEVIKQLKTKLPGVAGNVVTSERSSIARTDAIELRTASVPHDMLDWLDPHSPMHIVDARLGGKRLLGRFAVRQQEKSTELELVAASDNGTPTHCMKFSEIAENLRSGSTHQFDLLSVLQLSATLGKLPKQLTLWTVPIMSSEFGCVSDETNAAIHECAQQIAKELAHA